MERTENAATGRAHVRRGRWSSSRRAQQITLAGAVLLLELLPMQAVLLLLTAGSGARLGDDPVPPLVNAAALLFAWLIGWALRRRQQSAGLFLLGVPCFALVYVGLILTSPVAYGDMGLLPAAAADLAGGSLHSGNMLALLPVALYIWWRGYTTGRNGLTAHGVMRRFQFGMATVVLSAAGAAAVQGSARGELLGVLAIVLPVETFCGLLASALARFTASASVSREPDVRQAQEPDAPWLGVALTLSVVVVGFALLLSLVVNYDSVGALLARLGPIGSALGTAVDWITSLIAQLLYLLLHNFIKPPAPKTPLPAPTPGVPGACVPTSANHECQGAAALDPFWRHLVTLVMQGTALVVLAVGLFVVLRFIIFRRWLISPPQEGVEEERESLEGASLLGAQIRSLLGRLAPKRPAPIVDPLAPGTVRYMYRDVLRAAATAELARRPDETPDEFAERARRTAPLAVFSEGPADLDTLSAAYDAARYGEREPSAVSMGPLRQAAARLVRRLRRGG